MSESTATIVSLCTALAGVLVVGCLSEFGRRRHVALLFGLYIFSGILLATLCAVCFPNPDRFLSTTLCLGFAVGLMTAILLKLCERGGFKERERDSNELSFMP